VLATLAGSNGEAPANEALRALTEAGVPVLAFELQGARLSDAFLAMKETG
jgi:ABC-2 type transport system ATP-binding protein